MTEFFIQQNKCSIDQTMFWKNDVLKLNNQHITTKHQ